MVTMGNCSPALFTAVPVPGTVGFTYDANYRITDETVNGAGISFQYNADSDLIQAGNMTYSYHPTSGLITGTAFQGMLPTRGALICLPN